MKRIIAIFLSFIMLFTCYTPVQSQENDEGDSISVTEESLLNEFIPEYESLDDPELLSYIENLVYQDTVASLNSEEYFVEDVSAIYISKEYMEEVAYNSQSNIYFGYTLDEIDEVFQDTKYVFTLGENGETIVKELEEIEDTTMEAILKNVAIGTGVILVCVTVSAVTAGAPAVSVILAASATKATTFALSSAALGGIYAGAIRGIETGDFGEVIETSAIGASEGFKWGAFGGAIAGGKEKYNVLISLADETKLKITDIARIQKESRLPVDVIKQLHSMEEYEVYKAAGLKPVIVKGKTALSPNIDLDYISKNPDGTTITNLELMLGGKAPIDPVTGKKYQLHHIGQKKDGTLAILNETQHQGNSSILNIDGKESEINRNAFKKIRKEFWEDYGKQCANGGI